MKIIKNSAITEEVYFRMKRILFMIFKYIYIVPYWFVKICLYGKSDKYSEEERFLLLKKITTRINKGGRVIIESFGMENIPKEKGYVIFPNHQGLFDVLAFLQIHPDPFSIIVKKEVSDIILIKQVLRLLKGQAIDREDVRQSMKVIIKMTEEVKSGRNYLIFAEGTRSRDKNNILPFKGGSFKSAMNAKCPILPVALIDSYKAFDTNSIKEVRLQIHYLKPLYYEDYKDLKSTEIANLVRDRIDIVIKENENS